MVNKTKEQPKKTRFSIYMQVGTALEDVPKEIFDKIFEVIDLKKMKIEFFFFQFIDRIEKK